MVLDQNGFGVFSIFPRVNRCSKDNLLIDPSVVDMLVVSEPSFVGLWHLTENLLLPQFGFEFLLFFLQKVAAHVLSRVIEAFDPLDNRFQLKIGLLEIAFVLVRVI